MSKGFANKPRRDRLHAPRDRLIARLAALGEPDASLALGFGLGVRQVARILRAAAVAPTPVPLTATELRGLRRDFAGCPEALAWLAATA